MLLYKSCPPSSSSFPALYDIRRWGNRSEAILHLLRYICSIILYYSSNNLQLGAVVALIVDCPAHLATYEANFLKIANCQLSSPAGLHCPPTGHQHTSLLGRSQIESRPRQSASAHAKPPQQMGKHKFVISKMKIEHIHI